MKASCRGWDPGQEVSGSSLLWRQRFSTVGMALRLTAHLGNGSDESPLSLLATT